MAAAEGVKMQIDALLRDAQARVHDVTPEYAEAELPRFLVVDVREPQEVLHGFLPDALHVPRGVLEIRVSEDDRFRDREQAILCYSGTGVRSALAALTLQQLGFTNVHSLAGGINRWSDEDRPIK